MSILQRYKMQVFHFFLFLIGVWFFYGGMLAQWLGIAAVLYSGYELGGFIISKIPEKIRRIVYPYIFPSMLVALVSFVYRKMLFGHMPWIADHAVHQSKAFILWDKLLSSGHLTGWTQFAGPGGYPAETLYPPFADIFIILIKFITFSRLSWEHTYSLAVFSFLMFYVLTFYYIGKRLGGPLAGFIAAFFAMVDVGGFRHGGWVFAIRWGVWPLSFASALTLLSLIWFSDWVNKKRSPKWSIIIGSLAILTHPMSLLVIFPTAPLIAWFSYSKTKKRRTLIRKTLAYLALIVLLSAWWLVPFFYYAGTYSAHVSALSESINSLTRGLFNSAPWTNAWALAVILGGLGIVTLWRKQKSPLILAMITTSFGSLILGSSTFLAGMGFMDYFPALRNVQFPRYMLFVKATFYLAAGYYLARFLRFPRKKGLKYPWTMKLINLAILAALLLPSLQYTWERKLQPLTKYPYNPPIKAGLKQAAKALKQDSKSIKTFFRVAITGHFHEHRHTVFPIMVDKPFVKYGFVPSDTYLYRFKDSTADIPDSEKELKLQNIAYVLSIGPSRIGHLKVLSQKNNVYLYRYLGYESKRVYADVGDVKVNSFKDRYINLSLSNLPAEGGFVRIPLSPFARWRAYNNGEPVDILPYNPTKALHFTTVFAHNGSLTLKYERLWVDWAGDILTLLVLLFIFVPGRYTYPPLKKVNHFFVVKTGHYISKIKITALPVKVKWGGIVVLAIAGMFVLWKIDTYNGKSKQFYLSDATVTMVKNNHKGRCFWYFPQKWICQESLGYIGIESRFVQREVRTGIFLHPKSGVTYNISWHNPDNYRYLNVKIGIDDWANPRKGLPVEITIFAGSDKVGSFMLRRPGIWHSKRFDISGFKNRGNIRFSFTSKSKGLTNCIFKPTLSD